MNPNDRPTEPKTPLPVKRRSVFPEYEVTVTHDDAFVGGEYRVRFHTEGRYLPATAWEPAESPDTVIDQVHLIAEGREIEIPLEMIGIQGHAAFLEECRDHLFEQSYD